MTSKFDKRANELLEEKAGRWVLNLIQTVLDFVGIEPTVGTVADGVNGVISLIRAFVDRKDVSKRKRHLANMAISFISMLPAADVIKLVKLRRPYKAVKSYAQYKKSKTRHIRA